LPSRGRGFGIRRQIYYNLPECSDTSAGCRDSVYGGSALYYLRTQGRGGVGAGRILEYSERTRGRDHLGSPWRAVFGSVLCGSFRDFGNGHGPNGVASQLDWAKPFEGKRIASTRSSAGRHSSVQRLILDVVGGLRLERRLVIRVAARDRATGRSRLPTDGSSVRRAIYGQQPSAAHNQLVATSA